MSSCHACTPFGSLTAESMMDPWCPVWPVRSITEFMLSLPIGCLPPMMSRETRDST